MSLLKLPLKEILGYEHKSVKKPNRGRLELSYPLRFQILNPASLYEFQVAKTKEIGQSGLLFRTVTPPTRKSYILIEIDKKLLMEVIEADQHLVFVNSKIAAQVILTHLNLENGLFEIEARFVRTAEKNSAEFEKALRQCCLKLES